VVRNGVEAAGVAVVLDGLEMSNGFRNFGAGDFFGVFQDAGAVDHVGKFGDHGGVVFQEQVTDGADAGADLGGGIGDAARSRLRRSGVEAFFFMGWVVGFIEG
jgi:hypothetical protein